MHKLTLKEFRDHVSFRALIGAIVGYTLLIMGCAYTMINSSLNKEGTVRTIVEKLFLLTATLIIIGCSPAPTVGITCGGKDIWCPEGMICVQDPQLGGICTVNRDTSATPSCKTDDQCEGERICGESGTCVDRFTATIEFDQKTIVDHGAMFTVRTNRPSTLVDIAGLGEGKEAWTILPASSLQGDLIKVFAVDGLKPDTACEIFAHLEDKQSHEIAEAFESFTTNKSPVKFITARSLAQKIDDHYTINFYFELTTPARVFLFTRPDISSQWSFVTNSMQKTSKDAFGVTPYRSNTVVLWRLEARDDSDALLDTFEDFASTY